MRIETWNLKDRDDIEIYTLDGNVYKTKLKGKPFEYMKNLWIEIDRFGVNKDSNNIAVFREHNSHWVLMWDTTLG